MDQAAVPKRFYWLKRIVVGVMLFEAATLGLRYVAVARAQKRLAQEIDAIRARGEPILPEDFLDRPAPEEQNAAADLLAAQKLFKIPAGMEDAWYAAPRSPPFNAKEQQVIAAVLSANRAALAAVRQARGKPLANWGLQIRSPAIDVRLTMLNEMKDLSDALQVHSRQAILDGRDGEAVEDWRDMLVISRALAKQPVIVSQLVSNGVGSGASNTIFADAGKLRIGNSPGAASEAQVRALINELLEDWDGQRSGWQWAFLGERMFQLDMVLCLAQARPIPTWAFNQQEPGQSMAWWLRPMLLDDARELLKASSMDVEAAKSPDAATASARLGAVRTGKTGAYNPRHWWDMVLRNPNLSKLVMRRYQGILSRRQAAVALASRLYELKYGKRPASVQELVPEFLASAPPDPIAGGGAVVFMAAPATQATTRPNRY